VARTDIQGDRAVQDDDGRAVEFGAALRQTRLTYGRDLADVANQLRIRQVYLQAIEEGRFEALPGATYAIGFVRAYADYLGLDENEVVKRYKELRGGVNAQTNLVPPAPVAEGRLPAGPVLLFAVILAAAAYGGWYYLSLEGRDPGEVVAALPARIAQMVGMKPDEPVAPPEPAPAPTAASPAPAVPAAEAPAEKPAIMPAETAVEKPAETAVTTIPAEPAPAVESVSPAPEQPATPAAIAPVPPARAPEPASPSPVTETTAVPAPAETAPTAAETAAVPRQQAVAPAAAGASGSSTSPAAGAPPQAPEPSAQAAQPVDSRVVLRANASSWIEIRNAEERRVFSRLLRRGETYPVPLTPGLTLTTGNAGGLDVVVDGKTLPPLGKPGDVRRDVALDAEMLIKNVGRTR
jgi:cytoskeletal protein RodZ